MLWMTVKMEVKMLAIVETNYIFRGKMQLCGNEFIKFILTLL